PTAAEKPPRTKRILYVLAGVTVVALAGASLIFKDKIQSTISPTTATVDLQLNGSPTAQKITGERTKINNFYNQVIQDIKSNSEDVIYDSGNSAACYDSSDDETVLAEYFGLFKALGIDPTTTAPTAEQQAAIQKAAASKKIDLITSCTVGREIVVKTSVDKLQTTTSNSTKAIKANQFVLVTSEKLPSIVQMSKPVVLDNSKNYLIYVYESGKTYPFQPLPNKVDSNKYLVNPSDRLIYIKIADIHESFKATLPLLDKDKTVLDESLYEGRNYSYGSSRDKQFQAIDWQVMRPTQVPIGKAKLVVTDTSSVLEFSINSVSGGNATEVKQFEYTDVVKRYINPPQICNISDAISAARLNLNPVSSPKICEKLAGTKKGYIIYGNADLRQRYQSGYLYAQVNNTIFTYEFNSYGDIDANSKNLSRFSNLLDDLVPVDKNQLYDKT
ncbi:hypothetical protein KW803_01805, partial [Candidatus Saccharibacteria bacterium]|nr:hypothetical protein [Candidatus Saccharibacteria bacterium]